MAFQTDKESAPDKTSLIFRPTVLMHHADQRASQNAAERNKKLPVVRQRLPMCEFFLFPWAQISGSGHLNNISDLVGPKSCPLVGSIVNCPDQRHLQMVKAPAPKDHSLSIDSGSRVENWCTDHQQTIKSDKNSVIIHGDADSATGKGLSQHEYTDSDQIASIEAKKSTCRIKKFKCPLCTVTCGNMGQLRRHLRCHTGERPFVCNVNGCTRKFARNEELTRHKRIHSGVRPFQCETCNKTFGRKDHLQKHSKTHLTIDERKFHVCPVCHQAYSRSDALTRHKATAHAQ